MKILIISDTHRIDYPFTRVMEQEAPVDMILHAGDGMGSETEYERIAGMSLLYVRGNCDRYSLAPTERTFSVGGCRIFLTHGHLYDAHRTAGRLVQQARARGACIAVFGHTHIPGIEWIPDQEDSRWIPDDEYAESRRESWQGHLCPRTENDSERFPALANADSSERGLLLMNPGSLGRPRQSGGRPCYIILQLDRDGRVDAQIRFLRR